MPQLSASVNISIPDIEKLTGDIGSLIATARGGLDAARSGSDTNNPVGALVSALSKISGDAGQLPSVEPLLAPVREAIGHIPAQGLADVATVQRAIDSALSLFGPFKDVVLSGSLEQALQQAVARVSELGGRAFGENDETTGVFRDLEEFFRLFRALLGWKDQPPAAGEIVDLISRALAGVPSNIFENASASARALLDRAEHALLPQGPDLDGWRAAAGARTQFWLGIQARFDGGAAINWPQLETDLRAEVAVLVDLSGVGNRLVSAALGAVGGLDLSADVRAIESAIAAIPKVRPQQLTGILDGLRGTFERLATDLENWTPTEDEMRAVVRAFIDKCIESLEQSPLGRLRAQLIDFQHRLVVAVDSLPLKGIAREAERALVRVASAIDVIDPEFIRRPVREFFDDIERRMTVVSPEAVRNAVKGLWDGVATALNAVSEKLKQLRDLLKSATDGLKTFVDSAGSALKTVSESIVTIKETLDNFDLRESAQEVVDQILELRDTVEDLDLSALPAAAVSAVKAAAEALRQIDISGAIKPQLDEALEKADPTPLLKEALGSLSAVTDVLKKLDPAALAKQLDGPIDELLRGLDDFGPQRFKGLIQDAIRPVENAIRSVDLTKLVEPISNLYRQLTDAVDRLLDPEAIFRPLEQMYQPVLDLIDAIEPSKLIALIEPNTDSVTEKTSAAGGPPTAMKSAGSLLKDAIPAAPEANDPLFGFRPGDLLIPLIDLHRQLTGAFDRLDDAVLAPAAKLLRESLKGRLEELHPLRLSVGLDGVVAKVRAEFDPAALSARYTEAALAYHAAAGRIAAAVTALPQASADAQAAGRIVAMLPDLNPLRVGTIPRADLLIAASLRVRADLDLRGLRSAFPAIDALRGILPSFLDTVDDSAQSLRDELRALDPAPFREQINTLFDRVGRRIVGLENVLVAALEEIGDSVEQFMLPVNPSTLVNLAHRLHAGLREQVAALSPATLKDEVKLIFDTVKRQLTAFDPAALAAELNRPRDVLIGQIRTIADNVLPDAAPFDALRAGLADLRPSVILADVTTSLEPVSKLIATIDPDTLLAPLIAAIARVREEVPEVISDIEAAIDEVLAAFPEGGSDSVSASASVSIG